MSGCLLCTDIENQTDADVDDADADGEDDGLTSVYAFVAYVAYFAFFLKDAFIFVLYA